jgi:hypothetical protein
MSAVYIEGNGQPTALTKAVFKVSYWVTLARATIHVSKLNIAIHISCVTPNRGKTTRYFARGGCGAEGAWGRRGFGRSIGG